LDAVDEKLIALLKAEPRQTNRALAAALDLSEPTVASRIAKLEKEGSLRVMAVIEPAAAGYRHSAVFGVRVADRHPDEVAHDLARIPDVVAIASTLGRFELVGILFARNQRELGRLLNQTIGATAGVQDVESHLVLDVHKVRSDMGTLRALIQDPSLGPPLAGGELDPLEWKVVELLQQDGRMSYREVGRRLNTPEATIRSRLQRLESSNKLHLEAVTDLGTLPSHQTRAWVALRVLGATLETIARSVAKLDAIMFTASTLGRFNLVAGFATPSRQALLDLVFDQLAPLHGVRQIETWELVRTFKHDSRVAQRLR
jgi:DNA-binding Lrp family transcriptional regulator